MSVIVLIPAYNPDEKLLRLIEALVAEGFGNILVVNDGSAPQTLPIFERLSEFPQCTVLTHAVNLGKGRTIKTGLNHIYLAHPAAAGVVTVDADGQHLAPDVAKVVAAFRKRPDAMVIGARRFGKGTPLRSLVGNILSRYLFRFVIGTKVSDTQSGLRCFPRALLPQLLRLEGERYEYETNMLIATHGSTAVLDEEITTVYLEGNRASHFDPIFDSMKIYFLLFRFVLSSAFTSVIDFIVFALAYSLTGNILQSIVSARFVAGNINFLVNRGIVFHSHEGVFVTIIKYYSLLGLLGATAYFAIKGLTDAGVGIIAAKLTVETLLFLASFSIQRTFIFARRREVSNGRADGTLAD
jgi:glycosyltransferase involved in cell wall biosynthesis